MKIDNCQVHVLSQVNKPDTTKSIYNFKNYSSYLKIMSASKANTENAKCCNGDEVKLRILAIHGYRQNGDVFRQKTGSFRKIMHKYAQFTYITAPHKVIPVDNLDRIEEPNIGQSSDAEQYGWWFNRDDRTFRGIRKGGPAIGFEDSVRLIEETYEEHGPFDGLLGFSQGGCFVGLLCDLQNRGILKCKFNFAIISSGFKSGSLPHLKFFEDEINIPSMHIYGTNDQIIPKEMSEDLAACFDDDPVIVTHDGGHYLPASSAQKHVYQKFIKNCLLQKKYQMQLDDRELNVKNKDLNKDSELKINNH